jgi:hypothetical protein
MLDPSANIQSHMENGADYEPCHEEDPLMMTLWGEAGAGQRATYGK